MEKKFLNYKKVSWFNIISIQYLVFDPGDMIEDRVKSIFTNYSVSLYAKLFIGDLKIFTIRKKDKSEFMEVLRLYRNFIRDKRPDISREYNTICGILFPIDIGDIHWDEKLLPF